jgi:methyltransferase (TIGR00027 family)
MNNTRPSATALIVAGAVASLASRRPFGGLVTPEAATLGVAAALASDGPLRLLAPHLARPAVQAAIATIERAILPGIVLHYALRKRAIEELARRALADGIAQVVVIGAGFDPLALRLARSVPAMPCFEIDHPATQAVKRRALVALAPLPATLHLLPGDLTQQTPASILAACPAFDRSRPTLFVAEGLLMYFTPAAVDTIVRAIRVTGGPGSRFVFTVMAPLADGRIGFHGASSLLDRWLRWRGEPFRWALGRDALPGYLRARGFAPRAMITTAILRRSLAPYGPSDAPLAVGEYLCYADYDAG